jgi:hypothetical protein
MFDPVDLDRLKDHLIGSSDTIREALAHLDINCRYDDDEIEDRLLIEEVELCTNCLHWRQSDDITDDDDFIACIYCL